MERQLFGQDYHFDGVSFSNVNQSASRRKEANMTARQVKQRERNRERQSGSGDGRLNAKGPIPSQRRWLW